MKLSQLSQKRGRKTQYYQKREELAKLLANNLTSEQIGRALGIEASTARKWRARYYQETGQVIEQEKPEIARRFFVDSLEQFSIMERKLMQLFLQENGDPKQVAGLANSFIKIKEKQADFLTRLNVISPSATENRVTGELNVNTLKSIIQEYKAQRDSQPSVQEE